MPHVYMAVNDTGTRLDMLSCSRCTCWLHSRGCLFSRNVVECNKLASLSIAPSKRAWLDKPSPCISEGQILTWRNLEKYVIIPCVCVCNLSLKRTNKQETRETGIAVLSKMASSYGYFVCFVKQLLIHPMGHSRELQTITAPAIETPRCAKFFS